jgi:glucose/arabinose dehydrogenase
MRGLLLLVPAVLLTTAVLACGDDDVPPVPSPGTQAPTSAARGEASPAATNDSSPTETASETPLPEPTEVPVVTGLPSSVSLERVFPDLAFQGMTGLYAREDGSWLVTEQPGRIQLIDASGEASLFLDLQDRVNPGGFEEGLLGLALAPDHAASGDFYVYYSATNPRRSVISRFTSSPGGGDLASEEIILEVEQPFGNHNGGQIAFGPDGYLYIGLGDGGSARDPQGNGQNLETLLGSILRIDVSGGGPGYTVPPDNPFVGQGSARGEIWAYGMRNPWRFSFDAATGDLWVGDVGQNAREEIDVVEGGGNYGWNITEGFTCLGGGDSCNTDGLTPPVFDYPNPGEGCSVTGGFVYRGSAIPEMQGAYVYSDYCSGTIWALRYDGSKVTDQREIAQTGFSVSSFAQGNDLEIYVLEIAGSGGIYRLAP